MFQVPQLKSQTSLYLERVYLAGSEFAQTGGLSKKTQASLSIPMIEPELYREMANAQWDLQLAKIGACAEGSDQENIHDASYAFMRQMRAVFNPKAAGNTDGAFGIIMSVIAYLFLQTPFAPFFGILDQIAPLFMGVFTLWFAKWYPKRVAMGSFESPIGRFMHIPPRKNTLTAQTEQIDRRN